MGTVLWYTLRESFHRRMAIVLIVIGLLVTGVFLWGYSFETKSDGSVVALLRGRPQGPAPVVAEGLMQNLLSLCAGLWIVLGIFSGAPLLTSYLEKGWAEMLLSKGVPRWQMLLGRYLGALILFAGTLLLLIGIPALQFWIGAGVPPGRVMAAAGILAFSYAAILGLMTIATVAIPNPALAIILGFLQVIVAALLAQRTRGLYDVITAKWAQWLIDWVYRILPKTSELNGLSNTYYARGTVEWWPIWSTALFLAGALSFSIWLLRRKDF